MGLKVVDLFCGCGGMSMGLHDAGMPVTAGFDNWKPALDTYNLNLQHPGIMSDLADEEASIKQIRSVTGPIGADDIFVIAGGPPCQDYSTANKFTNVGSSSEGAKADLTMAYARIIGELRPDIFVMENVPRAAKSRNFAEMLDLIQGWGYSEFKRVLHVQDYGVPQDRSRFIVIGYKDKILDGIDGEFGPHSHLPPVLPSACLPDLDRYYRHPTTYKRRAIFATGELAPTVRGLNRPMPATYRQHPNDACKTLAGVRALTSMERARLQTFPDGFAFANPLSKGHNDQMVGNAVPSKFAEAIGRAVLNALKRNGRMAVPQGTSADLLEPAL